MHTGFMWKNSNFKISLRALICDAPAKSFVCGTKGHTGYSGCSKCMQEGEYIKNSHRISFPDTEFTLRTNENFKSRLDDEVSPEHNNFGKCYGNGRSSTT